MQYKNFKNVYFHLLEDSVRSIFLNFVACYSTLYQPHHKLLSPEQRNSFISTSLQIIVARTKKFLVSIRYLFLTMKQLFLKLLEEILICFEEELWTLTLRFFI